MGYYHGDTKGEKEMSEHFPSQPFVRVNLMYGCAIGDCSNQSSQPDNSFESWERNYQSKLDAWKLEDPKTIFGWCLKSFQ